MRGFEEHYSENRHRRRVLAAAARPASSLSVTLLLAAGALAVLAIGASLGFRWPLTAFAVHDDNMTSRGHHVSFPVTVGFGAKADIEATQLK